MVRQRSAKPSFTSSNLVDASFAEVVKLVDTRDLKSLGNLFPCGFDSRLRHAMERMQSPFIKFTYTILDHQGLPQQKSWIVNLSYIVSVEKTASNDLKMFLTNRQIVTIALGEELDAADVMNEILNLSAVGHDYNVYKIEAVEKK